jgi:hypothetical protein
MVLSMARQEAELCERWKETLQGVLEHNFRQPKDLIGKLA